MKLDILAFGAHPDDIELGCGGLLISEVKKGKKIGLVDLTAGELGSRGTVEIRAEEAQQAALVMDASIRVNLEMADGKFAINDFNLAKVIATIRVYRPEIVITNAPYDRHPDHGRAAKLVEEACFLSGLIKLQYDGVPSEPWRPKAIYQYMQFYHHKPDFIYDITEVMDVKVAAIKAHKSQFWNPESQEPATLIASKEFFDGITYRAAEFGLQAGFGFGEPFMVIRTPGLKNIFELY
ncbi:MAG: bacillithiol biosynthesis deacetylase BshB1 [Bacteroidia bacterium]